MILIPGNIRRGCTLLDLDGKYVMHQSPGNIITHRLTVPQTSTWPTKKKWQSVIILSLSSDPRSQSAIKKQWRLIARKHVLRLSRQDRDDRGRIATIAVGFSEMK